MDKETCWPFFHKWTKYAAPQIVGEASRDGGTVAQRRVCKRCDAVDYRRVGISNG